MEDLRLSDDERRALRRSSRQAVVKALSELGGQALRRQVWELAPELGGFSPRELLAPAPKHAAETHLWLVDHELAWALASLQQAGAISAEGHGVVRLTELPDVSGLTPAVVAPERLAELQALPYREYLRTPEWLSTRELTLARFGWACWLDIDHTEHLKVQHRSFERLGAEQDSDVIVLCRGTACHRRTRSASVQVRPRQVAGIAASGGSSPAARRPGARPPRSSSRPGLFRRIGLGA